MADQVLDTSALTIHELRNHAHSLFDEQEARLLVLLVSFGFKYGLPIDSDLVFDVRFLPNPNFVPHLKALTGGDAAVIEYMNHKPETGQFVTGWNPFWISSFLSMRRKGSLTSRSRSVAPAAATALYSLRMQSASTSSPWDTA